MAENLYFFKRQQESGKALFEALNGDNTELAAILLRRGADPNEVLAVEGVAPMHIGTGLGEEAVKLLLTYGGDPNLRSADGTTPLHVAASWGDRDVLRLLLQNGGNPYIRDREGSSVFEIAHKYNHDDCVKLLEVYCLLLNPEEDTLSNIPRYTYEFKGNINNNRKQLQDVDQNDLFLQDFNKSTLKDNFFQHEFQKHLDKVKHRDSVGSNVCLNVTSPDHPIIHCKSSSSSTPEEPSRHVVWADKLTQTLPYIPLSDMSDSNSSSSDTFITCSGEEQNQPHKFFTSSIFEQTNSKDTKESISTVDNNTSAENITSNYHIRTEDKNTLAENRTSNYHISTVNNNPLVENRTPNYQSSNFPISNNHCTRKVRTSRQGTEFDKRFARQTKKTWEPSLLSINDSLLSSDASFIERHKCTNVKEDNNNSDVFVNYDFAEFDSILTENSEGKKKQVSFAEKIATPCQTDKTFVVNQDVDKAFLMFRLKESLSSISSKQSSVSTTDNDVLNNSFHMQRNSLDSTSSMISDASTIDYIYTDKEKGIQFIERHLPSLQGSSGRQSLDSLCSFSSLNTVDSQQTVLYDWKAFSDTSTCSEDPKSSQVPRLVTKLSNQEIREQLLEKGDNPGPITDNTRQLYLVRLSKINEDPGYLKLCAKQPGYSPELCQAFIDWDPSGLNALEDKLISSFCNTDRCWREGHLKSSFNYLLLDPRVTKNLPNRMHSLGEKESFKIFVASIFYIGKGKRSRPYCHLYEAIRHMEKPKPQVCNKVKHILDIWNDNVGVVSLHCFQNVIPVEAYTREACMVDSVSLNRLTNKKRGDYYGISSTWSMKEKRRMGVFFLKKALQIFQGEGERQILPMDIKVGQ
ncbi:uncharacterized protein LOC143071614 [Mytilus galloprovincialis]|uniref:uncharacterized protein LOC143071614 n=1 Tax=Mytilus galloprovincialis TaxID=29158 RepID=UPI003F7C91E9